MLLASLANFLSHNVYPYFRLEVGMAVALALIVSALMSPFYRAQRQWGRSFLEGVLVALFFDLNTDSVILIIGAGVGVALYTFWRRSSLLGPIAVIGTITLILTLAGLGVRKNWISENQTESNLVRAPAPQPSSILHIILDEHIGIEGIPLDGERAKSVQNRLKSFYSEAGFSLYGGAYSEHLHTINAIPNLLNYGRFNSKASSQDGVVVGSTVHLNLLKKLGYRVRIFQSDFADYCTGFLFDSCTTYDSSSLAPTLAVPMSSMSRFELLMFKIFRLSNVASLAAQSWNLLAREINQRGGSASEVYFGESARSSTVGTLEAEKQLALKLKTAQPGEAYFVHLLMPHYPYVVDHNCNYLPFDVWRGRHSRISQSAKRDAYYEQVECTTRRVDALLNSFELSAAGKNATVIIHGDHGSRITTRDPNLTNLGLYTTEDAIAGFSTLFAVRIAGVPPRYYYELQPLSTLLEELASSEFKLPPKTNHPLKPLQLDDWEWVVQKRVDLPKGWTARAGRPDLKRGQSQLYH